MDGANKQTAVVAEVTQGTIPSTPGFKLLRDIRLNGSATRNAARSPERRADRMAYNMVNGINAFQFGVELPFMRDAGTDILLESALANAWSTNTLKNASTKKTFAVEEKFEGGATDPYRRWTGCIVDSLSLGFQANGSPATMNFGCVCLGDVADTAAISGATYASPSPGYDPVAGHELTISDLFSISSPKIMSLSLNIRNNIRPQYCLGSASPWGTGLGFFEVDGQVSLYFSQSSDWSTFRTRQSGLVLDVTIGTTSNYKDRIQLNAVDVWNPGISDDGNSSDHMVTLNFMAKYYASDTAAIVWTRNVA